MDERDRARLDGVLSAQTLLIEHLYRLLILERPTLRGWLADLGERQMAMVDEQEPLYAEDVPPAQRFAISQHALHHLELFWKQMDRDPKRSPRRDVPLRERPAHYAWRKSVPRR